jgi:preprotein translocase subunit SecG
MGFLIGLLTVIMVLDCVILIFLVLIQLPKKEAGAGLAFGAGATDALFGAGSGTVLTKITKYAAGIFFAMAIILSLLRNSYYSRNVSSFQRNLGQPMAPSTAAPRATTPTPESPSAPVSTNALATNTSGASIPVLTTPAALTNTAGSNSPK